VYGKTIAAILITLVSSAEASAEPLSLDAVVDLGSIAKKISSISWCSDDEVAFVGGVSSNVPQGAPSRSARRAVILSLKNSRAYSIAEYSDASIRLDCVLGGGFVYVSGSANVGYRSAGGGEPVTKSFNHLLEVLPVEAKRTPAQINLLWDVEALSGPVHTDVNGNIFARKSPVRSSMAEMLPSRMVGRKSAGIRGEGISYTARLDNISVTSFSSDQRKLGRAAVPIEVYGINTPEIGSRSIGFYRCAGGGRRPECGQDSNGKDVVYYTLLSAGEISHRSSGDREVPQSMLVTVAVGNHPLIKRWKIVSAEKNNQLGDLTVVDVALNERSCFVLLEPNRHSSSSRLLGKLRREIYVSDCEQSGDVISYYRPRLIGQRQGSFSFPRIKIHGEVLVLTEFYDQSSQEEDQIPLEKLALRDAKVCVRLFSGEQSSNLSKINALCAPVDRVGGGWEAQQIIVSPNAKFIAVLGPSDAIIVSSNFRNNGSEPSWLTNGE
jgi:hypothetical protein